MEDDKQYKNKCDDEQSLKLPNSFNKSYPHSNEVKVYKTRWYILSMYCLIAILQNIMWNTWGPIQATARAVYDWDDYVIDLMAAWGCITFCIAMLPFAWIMDVKGMVNNIYYFQVKYVISSVSASILNLTILKINLERVYHYTILQNAITIFVGLRMTMVLSSGLQFFGSALRCIPTDSNKIATVLMHCGQFIIGIAGGLSPAALISSTWFPPNQRTTSTALSTVASYVGSALGFIISPAFVDDVKDSNIPKIDDRYHLNSSQVNMYKKQINNLLYSEAGLQFLIFIAIVIYYPAKPKKPPSVSAGTERVDFKNGVKKLFKNYNFLLLATIYGASTGVYGGWCSVLYQNLSEYGISVNAKFAGWLGFVAVTSGAFSGVSFSM